MKTLDVFVFVLGSIAAAACGPKDVIPTAPHHPANPDAPGGRTGASPEEAGVEEDEGAKAQIASAEQAAYQAAWPILSKYCSNCHSSEGKKATPEKLDHFNIDSYPFGGHHATEIGETVRVVLAAGGGHATMPMDQPGAVKGEELDLIVAWTKAFDASHKAGLHDHGHHHGHGHGGH
jgi:mono/diheme cytochrome c family protein